MNLIPESIASRTASLRPVPGTKVTLASIGPTFRTASATVLKTGIPATSSPPLPGVTPAKTFVPYPFIKAARAEPSLPVIPCTRMVVSFLRRIAIFFTCLLGESFLGYSVFFLVLIQARDGGINGNRLIPPEPAFIFAGQTLRAHSLREFGIAAESGFAVFHHQDAPIIGLARLGAHMGFAAQAFFFIDGDL